MTLAVVAGVAELRAAVAAARGAGREIAVVPTMGALHEGHASLIRAAKESGAFVVVTIFVNPTQFGPHEDLARYPRPFEEDVTLCRRHKVDLVFAPAAEVVYPPGYRTYAEVDGLQDVLEGAIRPGHFRGVCTVVLKLFNMVLADIAFFGQKDAQQAIILRRMMRDLNVLVELRLCPTIREADGLALSSRNRYLSPEARRSATSLIRALRQGRDLILAGERSGAKVRAAMEQVVKATPEASLDYAAVVAAETLAPLDVLEGEVLLAVAARLGTTRLIDNVPMSILGMKACERDVLP